METAFWLDRWQRQDIGFHQPGVNDLLVRLWGAVGPPDGTTVFVPLAGKSRDLSWFADRGHLVIANELSELAVDAFFAAEKREPAVSYGMSCQVKRAAPFTFWQCNYFALPAEATRNAGAFYDRAALIAMPRIMQQAYADKLADLVGPGARGLLITLDYDPSEMNGPPFAVPDHQVRQLFSDTFAIDRLETREVLAANPHFRNKGLSALREAAYILTRRPT